MKNKILTISIVFILVCILSINNVFAYSSDEPIVEIDEVTLNTIQNTDEYKSGEYNVVFAYVFGDTGVNYMVFYPKNSSVYPYIVYSSEKGCYQLRISNPDCDNLILIQNNYYKGTRTDDVWIEIDPCFWANTDIYWENR